MFFATPCARFRAARVARLCARFDAHERRDEVLRADMRAVRVASCLWQRKCCYDDACASRDTRCGVRAMASHAIDHIIMRHRLYAIDFPRRCLRRYYRRAAILFCRC